MEEIERKLFLRRYLEQHLPLKEVDKRMPIQELKTKIIDEIITKEEIEVEKKKKEEKEKKKELNISSTNTKDKTEKHLSKVATSENQSIKEEKKEQRLVFFQSSRTLNDKEIFWAKVAWKYFETYEETKTGLVQTVAGYHVATLWDIGTIIAALISARQLNIIGETLFYNRINRILSWLEKMPLYRNELPNHTYRTDTGNFANRRGEEAKEGYGWATIDIGRYLIWLKVIATYYPNLKDRVEKIFRRYDFSRAIWGNNMYDSVALKRHRERLIKEDSFVYLGYARIGYILWNIQGIPKDPLKKRLVFQDTRYGPIPSDKKHHERLTSDPITLLAMEYGWPSYEWHRLSKGFLNAIVRYSKKRRLPFLPDEESVDRKPWFVYTTLSSHGRPFVCVDIRGVEHPELANLSLKAAFTLSLISKDNYFINLRNRLSDLLKTKSGFWAGQYENKKINRVLHLNTNGVILEALWFAKRGNLPFLYNLRKMEDVKAP